MKTSTKGSKRRLFEDYVYGVLTAALVAASIASLLIMLGVIK